MTTPASGAISIGNLNTDFGYGNSLLTYRYMYGNAGTLPVSLSQMYNKDGTKRGIITIQMFDNYFGGFEQDYGGPSGLTGNVDGIPYGYMPEFISLNWNVSLTNGLSFGLRTKTNGVYLPQNYFAAFHIPGIIWLNTSGATYSNSYTSGVSYWRWVCANPFANNVTYNVYLEK